MSDTREELSRCRWCLGNELYIQYHDNEWGKPLHNDQQLFEFLILEGAQAGLSWITILKKRDAYREAFDKFDPEKVAAFNQEKIEQLMQNRGIVRNRRKITSAIKNATAFLAIQKEFGSFDHYIWQFVNYKPIINHFKTASELPSETELSVKISIALKKRGFNFVGPTIIYAFLQAIGIVNDHTADCFKHVHSH